MRGKKRMQRARRGDGAPGATGATRRQQSPCGARLRWHPQRSPHRLAECCQGIVAAWPTDAYSWRQYKQSENSEDLLAIFCGRSRVAAECIGKGARGVTALWRASAARHVRCRRMVRTPPRYRKWSAKLPRCWRPELSSRRQHVSRRGNE
eukprot:356412-Chlamydomonas_euryale.AAC.2